jgi:iron complex outermembrane receptor protein
MEGYGELKTSLSMTYRGEFKHRVFNNPVTDEVGSYTTFDLLMKLTPDNSPWTLELIGKNLTDQDGINARFTDVFGVGATGDQYIPPRHLSVRVGMTF